MGDLHGDVLDSFGVVKVPATTRGFECIEFAEEVMGISLMPWQKWLLIHALELNPDGTFRFRIIVLLVARQNGKSTLMQVLSLWRMYVDGAPLVIGTAQTLDVAEEQWEGAVELAESIPELAEEVGQVIKVNGKKTLRLVSGQRYRVKAATRKGARGLAGDLVLLDEIREHQQWDAWASVTKTTMARRFAQIWAASNAGDISSVVLRFLRALGHQALGWPDGEEGIADALGLQGNDDENQAAAEALASLGIFEWSAAPGTGKWDRDGWAQANPALGYSITERDMAVAALDPEPVFRTENLCQFVLHMAQGPFPAGAWDGTSQSVEDRRLRGVQRDTGRALTYGVDVSADGKMAYVAVAFWDTEGRIRFEVAAQRAGVDWLLPWLLSPDRLVPADHVVFQSRGAPVSALAVDFELAGIDVASWEGSALAGWHAAFYSRVVKSVQEEDPAVVITHGAQPVLDLAANSAAIKPTGDGGWLIDRKGSPHDPAPLVACIAAVGLLLTDPAPRQVSAYETNDLMVV